MRAQGNSEESPRTRVNVSSKQSWLWDKCYSDMFTGFTRFPQKHYRFARESLTPRDKFIVEFSEQADRYKGFLPPNT